MQAWDAGTLEAFFCELGPRELCACASVAKAWMSATDSRRRSPWRAALQRLCPGLCRVRWEPSLPEEARLCERATLLQWPGVEVALPPEGASSSGKLLALPLRAVAGDADSAPVRHGEAAAGGLWVQEGTDCRSLARSLSRWYGGPAAAGGALPVCPMCAGVAYYQGPLFTRADIETGWQAYLLCDSDLAGLSQDLDSASPPELLASTWTRMGLPPDVGPSVAVQLRPEGGPVAHAGRPLADPGAPPETIGCPAQLWRNSGDPLAEFILSLSVPASHRLYLAGRCAADIGITVFLCEQVGKYALTSRTRVGRYLDDQPALMPRAHVFGVIASERMGAGVPAACLAGDDGGPQRGAPPDPETCPCCGDAGLALLGPTLELCPQESFGDGGALGDPAPFNGTLWVCARGAHLWGWRVRAPTRPVMVD